LGLVLLCRACSEVLLARRQVNSVDSFVSLWRECISTFDELYENDSDESDNNSDSKRGTRKVSTKPDLFRLVSVCGNGYVICKKVEALLRHVFSSHEGDDSVGELNQDGTVSSSRQPISLSRQLRADSAGTSRPTSHPQKSAALIDAPPDAVCWKYATVSTSRPNSTRSLSTPQSRSTSASTTRPSSVVAMIDSNQAMVTVQPYNTVDNHQEGIVEIAQVYDLECDSIDVPDSDVSKSAKSTAINSQTNHNITSSSQRTGKQELKGKKSASDLRGNNSMENGKNDTNPTKLTDYYPHFNMIFPVVFQHQQSNR
jgi:hypothetical protein